MNGSFEPKAHIRGLSGASHNRTFVQKKGRCGMYAPKPAGHVRSHFAKKRRRFLGEIHRAPTSKINVSLRPSEGRLHEHQCKELALAAPCDLSRLGRAELDGSRLTTAVQ
jgi:hypothetical protein